MLLKEATGSYLLSMDLKKNTTSKARELRQMKEDLRSILYILQKLHLNILKMSF